MPKYIQKQWLLQDVKRNMYYLYFEDIIYLETCNRCVRVITKKESINTCYSLNQIQAELPENFLRIHRSIIINLTYIYKISRYEITMRNGATFPVPEKKYMIIKDQIQDYMNKKNSKKPHP